MWSWKNEVLMFLAAKLSIFCIQQELSKSNDKSKSVPKKITQIVSSQLFQEIYKVKILSSLVYPCQKNDVI